MTINPAAFGLLFLLAASVLLSLPRLSLQAPVQQNFATYRTDVAKKMLTYCNASYNEDLSSLASWTCANGCTQLSSFRIRRVVSDSSLETRAFIGYDHDLRSIVIAFRGSEELENWQLNFYFWPVETQLFYHELNAGEVHDGFRRMYASLREELISEVEAMMAESEYANSPIFVTGHSLGGALVTLCSLDFSSRYSDKKVIMYSFSSPRVGDRDFAEAYAKKVHASFRVVNKHDPFTSLPPSWIGYKHVGTKEIVSETSDHSNFPGLGKVGKF